MRSIKLWLLSLLLCIPSADAWAQRGRKPQRSTPPEFSAKDFEGTFFSDVSSVLQGTRPASSSAPTSPSAPANLSSASTSSGSASAPNGTESAGAANPSAEGWNKLISAATIEDLVKNAKLRLDPLVASSTKFAGAFKEARREFSLLALMFAIIEEYPGEVRWKKSAALARAAFVASPQVAAAKAHTNAKERVQDLNDLFSGGALEGAAPPKSDWARVIERVPLMQLLEWAQQEHINPLTASPEKFSQNKEELVRYAELVAVLGKAAMMEGMRDADDPEYQQLATQMVAQATQITLAVQTDNADLARTAAGQLGQSCVKCHDGYR